MPKKPVTGLTLSVLLLVSDLVGLTSAFCAAFLVRFGEWPTSAPAAVIWPLLFILFSLYVLDTYRIDTQISGMRASVRAIIAVATAGLLSSAVVYIGGYWGVEQFFGRGVFPVALALFAAWSACWRFLLFKWSRRHAEHVRWLVLGTGEPAHQLLQDFKKAGLSGELHFLAEDKSLGEGMQGSGTALTVTGSFADLACVGAGDYAGVIIATSSALPNDSIKQLMKMRFAGTHVYDLSDFYEHYWSKVPVFHLKDGWFVFSSGFDLLQNLFGLRAKRVFDILVSVALLVLLSPILVLIAAAIRLDSAGPAIYRQKRMGQHGKVFTIYKFRSMHTNAEVDGARWAGQNDSRVTSVGRVLRVMRLDELPQLLNVVRGDMSFIGPRPERPEFADMLESSIPYYEHRHLVRPGITGWAQVMYPYGASVEDAREKLQYDLYYIKRYSLLLDIAILFKTVRVVLLGKGR